MIEGFNINEHEWDITPSSVRIAALSLNHQLRLLHARFNLHQHQLIAFKEKADQAELEYQAQAAENERLTREVARLKEQLGLNSSNSSLPPSSDSPFRKPTNKIKPSGRKQGGQVGHLGQVRYLLDADEVDTVVELRPKNCTRCGCRVLEQDWLFPARRQVTKITVAGTITTEYQQHALRCLACGTRNRAAWPPEATNGAFGARVQAIVAYLTGRLNLSHRDTVEALGRVV